MTQASQILPAEAPKPVGRLFPPVVLDFRFAGRLGFFSAKPEPYDFVCNQRPAPEQRAQHE